MRILSLQSSHSPPPTPLHITVSLVLSAVLGRLLNNSCWMTEWIVTSSITPRNKSENGWALVYVCIFIRVAGLQSEKKFFIIYLFTFGCTGFSLVVVRRLLIAVASLIAEHELGCLGSAVAAWGLSCPLACGIFPDQDSTHVPSIGRRIFNQWTIWEVLKVSF